MAVCRARWAFALVAGAALALSGCGRGNLDLDDGVGGASSSQGSGAGSQGAGAGAVGTGSGSGAGTTAGSGPSASSSGSGASSGSSGSGSTGSGQMTCTPFGDPCTNCASQNCPDIWCDCTNNAECIALFGCFGQCNSDPVCEEGCLATHPNGIADVLKVSGCAGTTCDLDCDWGDPNFGDCQECIFNNCAAETNACISMPDCIGLWNCLSACPQLDLTCQSGCYSTFPSGIQTLETWLQCSNQQCAMECS